MAKLKPYISATQSLPSLSNPTLPFPNSKININYHLRSPKPFPISQSHSTPKPQQIIVCAKRQQWSNRKILQLASKVAFNLKILPEPFNSFLGQIARSNSNENRILNSLIGGVRVKSSSKKRNGNKFLFPVFVLICVAGLWSWRISELDLFVRSLFGMVGISSISLLLRNKGIKNWFLGFFFGVVLMMSFKLGKEDVEFWVEKLRTCSPVAQIVMGNRNRKWRISK
ncbi:unnamed protein product [Trifolium pratense]|uniref:Uncharacterized protein n=1 Tax=Trifolium pratense TaxID=57577 RepID=A0ACB0I915_TRIPR|nr:unnamed protein product [Trifolium pratense]